MPTVIRSLMNVCCTLQVVKTQMFLLPAESTVGPYFLAKGFCPSPAVRDVCGEIPVRNPKRSLSVGSGCRNLCFGTVGMTGCATAN